MENEKIRIIDGVVYKAMTDEEIKNFSEEESKEFKNKKSSYDRIHNYKISYFANLIIFHKLFFPDVPLTEENLRKEFMNKDDKDFFEKEGKDKNILEIAKKEFENNYDYKELLEEAINSVDMKNAEKFIDEDISKTYHDINEYNIRKALFKAIKKAEEIEAKNILNERINMDSPDRVHTNVEKNETGLIIAEAIYNLMILARYYDIDLNRIDKFVKGVIRREYMRSKDMDYERKTTDKIKKNRLTKLKA